LKYAGATTAVVGASALGLDLLSTHSPLPSQQSTTAGIHQPPSIKNLQWTATRTVNGKVYDGTISFQAEGANSPVVGAELTFDPVYPQEIPMQAFTPESNRSYSFSSNAMTADFTQTIPNLVGGKQYRAQVTVKDKYGGMNQANLDIPYVREFENIAKMDTLLVGASYHPWWENPCIHYCHWDELGANYSKGTTPLGTPLLGLYSSNDPLVISKHIDWATGYGIDTFWCSYNGSNVADSYRMPPLMTNELINDIKIAFLYETPTALGGPNEDLSNVNLNSPSTYAVLESHFRTMASKYFSHPSYLKVNGRPVVYLYQSVSLAGDISSPITKLRKSIKNAHGLDLYLIGDEMNWDNTSQPSRLKAFDAITYYGLPHASFVDVVDKSPETARMEYSRWQSAAHSVGVEIIPAPIPGHDDRNLCKLGVRKTCYSFPKSPEFFEAHMKVALDFVDKSRLMMIVSWDEWAENSFVEPTVEDGFKYLQAICDTLAGH